MEVSGQGQEFGSVEVEPDGTITARTGSSSHSQGHETSFAQVIANSLGIPFESIHVLHGDTRATPTGAGTGGSRSLVVGASALAVACATTPGGLRHDDSFAASGDAVPFGATIAVVTIDRETGRVHIARLASVDDCGTVVNPLIVDGRGLTQGVGRVEQQRHAFWGRLPIQCGRRRVKQRELAISGDCRGGRLRGVRARWELATA